MCNFFQYYAVTTPSRHPLPYIEIFASRLQVTTIFCSKIDMVNNAYYKIPINGKISTIALRMQFGMYNSQVFFFQ